MKNLYQKYINWIVILLVVLCSFKTCQSCSRSRQLEYLQSIQIETTESYKDTLNIYKDSLKLKQIEVTYLNDKIKSLKGSNAYLRNTNKGLIKVNEKLSNKEEK